MSEKYLDYGGSIDRVVRGANKFSESSIEQLKLESDAIKAGFNAGNLRNVLVTNTNKVSVAAQEQFDGVYSDFKDGSANVVKALPSVGLSFTNTVTYLVNALPAPIIIPEFMLNPFQNSLFRRSNAIQE
jgi:hypothetical protein